MTKSSLRRPRKAADAASQSPDLSRFDPLPLTLQQLDARHRCDPPLLDLVVHWIAWEDFHLHHEGVSDQESDAALARAGEIARRFEASIPDSWDDALAAMKVVRRLHDQNADDSDLLYDRIERQMVRGAEQYFRHRAVFVYRQEGIPDYEFAQLIGVEQAIGVAANNVVPNDESTALREADATANERIIKTRAHSSASIGWKLDQVRHVLEAESDDPNTWVLRMVASIAEDLAARAAQEIKAARS